MRPSINSNVQKNYNTIPRRKANTGGLTFRPFDPADIATVQRMISGVKSRTCDFTIGGIFLWDDYFAYTRAINNGTLFIRGLCENDTTRHAFSLPVGDMSTADAIGLLRKHCIAAGIPLTLSAVPEVYLDELQRLGAYNIEEIPDWADYLYDLDSLATLSGKKLGKKRNHVNRFNADHPDASFLPLTPDLINPALDFVRSLEGNPEKSPAAMYELRMNERALRHFAEFPFEGAVLTTPADGIVGLTIAEPMGDTLHVHIEKMRHDIAGAGETLTNRFAMMMKERHPQLIFENRQEDTGDPGLRQAKLTWQPIDRLRKFNLEIPL